MRQKVVAPLAAVAALGIAGAAAWWAWDRGSDLGPSTLSSSDACHGKPFSCVMTFDTGVLGVPLPREDLQFGSFNEHEPFVHRSDVWQTNTRYGTVADYVDFYQSFMPAAGWTPVEDQTGPSETGEQLTWDRGDGARVTIFIAEFAGPDDVRYVNLNVSSW